MKSPFFSGQFSVAYVSPIGRSHSPSEKGAPILKRFSIWNWVLRTGFVGLERRSQRFCFNKVSDLARHTILLIVGNGSVKYRSLAKRLCRCLNFITTPNSVRGRPYKSSYCRPENQAPVWRFRFQRFHFSDLYYQTRWPPTFIGEVTLKKGKSQSGMLHEPCPR